jgi:predicted RNase H-like HicB family nuclease
MERQARRLFSGATAGCYTPIRVRGLMPPRKQNQGKTHRATRKGSMPDTVTISIRLNCFVREEGVRWISACPSLDVYSQGRSEGEAKASLEEAISLWIESCIERNTLGRALQELGFRLAPWDLPVTEEEDEIRVRALSDDKDIFGHTFPLKIEIPAYQAALAMSGDA